MKFDWSRFTEDNYKNMLNGKADWYGAVHIGDICIELVVEFCNDEKFVICNFFVAHEDTCYGYKNDVLPYDYADGFDMEMPYNLSYDKFKANVENLSMEYIMENDKWRSWNCETNQIVNYSLVDHANRPLEIW